MICVETSTVQPIDIGLSSQGFARTVVSELRVDTASAYLSGEATVVRHVLQVNGRLPREKDEKKRDGCTDPNPLSTEPLAFLLPAHRSEYRFTSAGLGTDRNRSVFLIDFTSANRKSDLELIEDKEGHDDCFDWTGHTFERGRVWVDTQTYDVVRVERRIGGPTSVRVPLRIQRRHGLNSQVVLVRDDTTIRYTRVSFQDPEEVLLLPESIDSIVLVQGGLQSSRRRQTYTDFRRFVGNSRVVD